MPRILGSGFAENWDNYKYMDKKLNPLAFGYAGALVAALTMLLLGVLGNLGIYLGAVEMMAQWHVFFNLSIIGIITGIIEAAIITFAFLYLFGWLYNKLSK